MGGDSVISSLESEKASLWTTHQDWSEQQLQHAWTQRKQQIVSYLVNDAERPGAFQDVSAATDMPTSGPSGTSNLDTGIPKAHATSRQTQAVSMTRAASERYSHSRSFPPASIPTQPRDISNTGGTGKRGFRHIDLDSSQTGSCTSTSSWSPTETNIMASQPRVDDCTAYSPSDWVNKLTSNSQFEPRATNYASKKPRSDGFDQDQWLSHLSTHAPDLCMPTAQDLNPSTSMSTQLSSFSVASSAPMSRQSSETSASSSVIAALDMMRVQSSFSTASDISFALDDLDCSLLSSTTEKPNVASQPAFGYSQGSGLESLSNVSYGAGALAFPSFDENLFTFGGQFEGIDTTPQLLEAEAISRAHSQQSASSASSADLKYSERRRKHIENAKQSIAPKSLPQGPKSTSHSPADSKMRPLKPLDRSIQRKEPISKAPYVRPQHPKVKCDQCNEFPNGFRGEHELRRHYDRAHAANRKVWICVEPPVRTEWWPAKPLGICKQCKQNKHYNVYYNAAAHLRRAHFCPRKRGRKARGEHRESRAGKAGGDWPPIEWLKANGWLKEIEVTSEEMLASNLSMLPELEQGDPTMSEPYEEEFENADVPTDPGLCFSADVLGFSMYPPMFDFISNSANPTQIDTNINALWPCAAPVAPMMEHTMSAPASFSSAAGMNFDPSRQI